MHPFLDTIAVLVVLTVSCCDGLFESLNESSRLRYTAVRNPHIPLNDDCALRAFGIEMATYIAPASSKNNWTTLSYSAFQMDQCNATPYTAYQPSSSVKPFQGASETPKPICHSTVFVHDAKGNDLYEGTLERPMKTIQASVSRTRTLRSMYGSDSILCITIRGGTYYLGTNATASSSQIGAIALTTNDSNLVIENYQDERVILSGGTLLKLQWSVHSKIVTGGTIMKAQIPSYVNLDRFNELYIDGRRAIVAKYPNGDPSTQGLHTKDSGFSFDAKSWVPPVVVPSLAVHVQEPNRNGTAFPNYHISIGGGMSDFNPPYGFRDTHFVPRGLNVKQGALPHLANWTKPTTGYLHAFHSAYWGTWIFQIASINTTENGLMFGRGGFQLASNRNDGGAFYVANIFEELDSPNEWFLDKDTRTLYFMPNETMPDVFVASQIPCLISISGSSIENHVRNVQIRGLILTETSSTYMADYMAPSGGDWALHRGGTLYLTNTRNVTITHNLFTQLGSNAVAMIDYNENTSITLNEFVWLVDSGIILVGSTDGIDGFSVKSQPTNTVIQSNLFHEIGIYNKQTAPVFIGISRSTSVIGNLMFNMPRAGININDGFYGNHTISWNVIFNAVRETTDHGPINTWDRQPYLSDGLQSGVPSLWQHPSYIHHNVVFNSYGSIWPLDHDDGSCFYEDSYNFLVYGGKKNYLGHSKTDHHEIYVYADANSGRFGSNVCLDDANPQRGLSGWNETWITNICTLYNDSTPYYIGNCDTSDLLVPYLANNTIYISPDLEAAFICKVNGTMKRLSLQQWQSYGLDLGTTVKPIPDIQTIIQWGREMLQHTV